MISLNKISKSYGKEKVLNEINFKVEQGDFIALLGKNGSGKTTIVNLICQLIKPDSGKIQYEFDQKELYQKIGVQTQEADFDERLTVSDVCKLWMGIYQVDQKRLENLLEQFDLTKLRKRFIKKLSGGQKQRLNIVMSILHDPEIIIFDELTTSLDAISRQEVREYLKSLNQSGKTIILVSHYMDEVEELCNRIVLIKDGIVVEDGHPKEIMNQYHCENLQEYFVKQA